MMAATGSVPACVIPATRAAALSLGPGVEGNVALTCRGDGEMTFDPELARAIAGLNEDPALPGNTPVTAADRLQDAAAELVKLARLLPAALVARVTDDPAAWAAREDALILGLGISGDTGTWWTGRMRFSRPRRRCRSREPRTP